MLKYTSAEFNLGDDLKHLDRVQQAGAAEGTIFYHARVLEVLTADALKLAGLPASAVVLSNLIVLEQFALIPTTTRYWAHALRRLGNTVRHLHRRVTSNDANVALEFTERMLQWFFCRLDDGRRLLRITADGGPIWHDTHPELHALMEAFDAPRFDPLAVAGRIEAAETLMMTPALPAVLAEILLDRDECVAAEAVLCRALTLFPTDVRLQQLMGLYHSRTGNLDAALSFLEPLYESLSDDEETAGILGGIYKRAWRQERNKGDWLARAHRAYGRGWERSKSTNAYTGINAATTALWLGRPAEAQEIAEKVRALLRRRAEALSAKARATFNYWDRVSLAEAELVAGNATASRELYREAFAAYVSHQGDIKVSKDQLGEILSCLGLSTSPADFLADPSLAG